MGEWSIEKPSSHPLASIDQTGKVTFADHDVMTAYTIKFTGSTAETKCEQTELRGDIVVYPCTPSVPCNCYTEGIDSIGSGTTSSKIIVGHHRSSNCSGGWSTSLKSGVDILRDIEFRDDGNIYAYVISANTSSSSRITQYNTSIGTCHDYFSVTQLGNNPTPTTKYSYTLHTNHDGETVVFTDSSGKEYTYTTDSSGNAVHTATTSGQMTVKIVSDEDIIDYGDGNVYHGIPIYQFGGSTRINADETVNILGAFVRYTTNNKIGNAAVVFGFYTSIIDETNLKYDEIDLSLEGRSLPEFVTSLKFVNGKIDTVNSIAKDNSAEGSPSRSGIFTMYINGISTNKSLKVFQY